MTANEFLLQAVLQMIPRFQDSGDAEIFDEGYAQALYDSAFILTMKLAEKGELTENK